MGATESSSGLCDASMDRPPPRMPQKFPYYQAVCPPSLISHSLFDVPLRRAIIKTPHKEGAALDGGKGDDDVTSAVQSTSEKLGRFKGEAERQAYLEGDPRAEEVRPWVVEEDSSDESAWAHRLRAWVRAELLPRLPH